MMNPWFRLGHLCFVCLLLGLFYGAGMREAKPTEQIDRLAKTYRVARTEFERRAVCLDAIDAGVIARGRSVAVVDAVFGTSYVRQLPTGGGLEVGVVDFHPLPPPPSDSAAAAHIGWYLAFEFDSTGKLQNYYISNIHK